MVSSQGRIMKQTTGKYAIGILATGLLAVLLTACGGAVGKDTATYEAAASDNAYDAGGGIIASETVELAEAEDAVEEGMEPSEVPETAASDRKLIKNVNMSVETEQFDSLVPSIEQRVAGLGGYIEEMSSYRRNNEYASGYQGTKYFRYASMTVRIPKENLDTFLEEVGRQSNVVSRSESVTDVTLQYVDLESHKKALLTEQDRLLELMEQAETVEDIITIEGRLSEVRYQIESMEAQLRTYDNKIDYSTVYLNIDEVEHYSPAEDATVSERIRNGFAESVEGVGRGFQNFGIWFVIKLPYLFVWAVVIIIVLLVVRAIVRKNAKKNIGRARVKDPYLNPYLSPYPDPSERTNPQDNRMSVQTEKPAENGNAEQEEARDSR